MKTWKYQITVHPDHAAGEMGMTDVVRITVESGDPGGCLEFPFEEHIRSALRKWYDGGTVRPPVLLEDEKEAALPRKELVSVVSETCVPTEALQVSRDLQDLQDLFRCLLNDLEELHGKDRSPIPDHESGAAWDLYCRIQEDEAALLKKYGRPQGADRIKAPTVSDPDKVVPGCPPILTDNRAPEHQVDAAEDLKRLSVCQGELCPADDVPDDWKGALSMIQSTVRKALSLDHLLEGLERMILEYQKKDKELAREGKTDAVSVMEVTGRIRKLIQEAGMG